MNIAPSNLTAWPKPIPKPPYRRPKPTSVRLDPVLASVPRRTNALIKFLPPGVADRFRGSLRTVKLLRGQHLCEQGERPEFIYFPVTSVVSELRLLADGRFVELAMTGREGSIGLCSIFSTQPSASCSQVAQDGTAIRIERDVLLKMARLHPEIATLLMPDVAEHIKQISQRSICNMYHCVRERFATWLLMLSDRSGTDSMKMTHEQVSRSLGVYRPSATNIAIELRNEGIIEYSRGTVIIKDRTRLAREACSCYSEI